MLSQSVISGSSMNQEGKYLFKVRHKNTRLTHWNQISISIPLKALEKTSGFMRFSGGTKRHHNDINWRRSGVFIINFEHFHPYTQHINLVFLFITLNMYLPTGRKCFFCINILYPGSHKILILKLKFLITLWTQLTFTCSKSTIDTLKKAVKYVQI